MMPNPTALRHLCLLGKGINDNTWGYSRGLPLHYYLSRRSNVDLKGVKILVSGYPDALTIGNEVITSAPIHTILFHPNVDTLSDIVEFLVEATPSSIRLSDCYG